MGYSAAESVEKMTHRNETVLKSRQVYKLKVEVKRSECAASSLVAIRGFCVFTFRWWTGSRTCGARVAQLVLQLTVCQCDVLLEGRERLR